MGNSINIIYDRNFGSDPEFFVAKGTEIIPPAALEADFGIKFKGITKNNKRILLEEDMFRYIEDGAAVELNFKSPINSPELFYNTVRESLSSLGHFLFAYNLDWSKQIVMKFNTKKYWEGRGAEFLDCVRFGCDRDYKTNYYDNFDGGCEIKDVSKHGERYAGGHIHIQNMSNNPDIYRDNINLFPIVFDLFLGTANVLIPRSGSKLEEEKARLKYYGFPGRYRLQNYGGEINGVEYRPPSNLWTTDQSAISRMFCVGNICGNIIENNLAIDFVELVSDNFAKLYKALLTFDTLDCTRFLQDAVELGLKLKIIDLFEVNILSDILKSGKV
jgi:hypothetical protein